MLSPPPTTPGRSSRRQQRVAAIRSKPTASVVAAAAPPPVVLPINENSHTNANASTNDAPVSSAAAMGLASHAASKQLTQQQRASTPSTASSGSGSSSSEGFGAAAAAGAGAAGAGAAAGPSGSSPARPSTGETARAARRSRMAAANAMVVQVANSSSAAATSVNAAGSPIAAGTGGTGSGMNGSSSSNSIGGSSRAFAGAATPPTANLNRKKLTVSQNVIGTASSAYGSANYSVSHSARSSAGTGGRTPSSTPGSGGGSVGSGAGRSVGGGGNTRRSAGATSTSSASASSPRIRSVNISGTATSPMRSPSARSASGQYQPQQLNPAEVLGNPNPSEVKEALDIVADAFDVLGLGDAMGDDNRNGSTMNGTGNDSFAAAASPKRGGATGPRPPTTPKSARSSGSQSSANAFRPDLSPQAGADEYVQKLRSQQHQQQHHQQQAQQLARMGGAIPMPMSTAEMMNGSSNASVGSGSQMSARTASTAGAHTRSSTARQGGSSSAVASVSSPRRTMGADAVDGIGSANNMSGGGPGSSVSVGSGGSGTVAAMAATAMLAGSMAPGQQQQQYTQQQQRANGIQTNVASPRRIGANNSLDSPRQGHATGSQPTSPAAYSQARLRKTGHQGTLNGGYNANTNGTDMAAATPTSANISSSRMAPATSADATSQEQMNDINLFFNPEGNTFMDAAKTATAAAVAGNSKRGDGGRHSPDPLGGEATNDIPSVMKGQTQQVQMQQKQLQQQQQLHQQQVRQMEQQQQQIQQQQLQLRQRELTQNEAHQTPDTSYSRDFVADDNDGSITSRYDDLSKMSSKYNPASSTNRNADTKTWGFPRNTGGKSASYDSEGDTATAITYGEGVGGGRSSGGKAASIGSATPSVSSKLSPTIAAGAGDATTVFDDDDSRSQLTDDRSWSRNVNLRQQHLRGRANSNKKDDDSVDSRVGRAKKAKKSEDSGMTGWAINEDDWKYFKEQARQPQVKGAMGASAAVVAGAAIFGPMGVLAGAAAVGIGIGFMQMPENKRETLKAKSTSAAQQVYESAQLAADAMGTTCATACAESGVAEKIDPKLAQFCADGAENGCGVTTADLVNEKVCVPLEEKTCGNTTAATETDVNGNAAPKKERADISEGNAEGTNTADDGAEEQLPQRRRKVACMRKNRIVPIGQIHSIAPPKQPRAWLDVMASANTTRDEKDEAMEELLILFKDKSAAHVLLEEGILDSLLYICTSFLQAQKAKVGTDVPGGTLPKITNKSDPEFLHVKKAAICCVNLGKAHCAMVHTEGDLLLMSAYTNGSVPVERQLAQMLYEIPHYTCVQNVSGQIENDIVVSEPAFELTEISLRHAEKQAKSILSLSNGDLIF